MDNALRISKTIMRGTITRNREGGIFEQKVKYIEKDWGGGRCWRENVTALLDDQTDKVSRTQPFLAVAYVLSGSDH